MRFQLINWYDFKITFLTETVVGESPVINKVFCEILSSELGISQSECKKVVIQQRDRFLKRILRVSSIRGLIRFSSEFLIELLANQYFDKSAVCSFVSDLKSYGVPVCIYGEELDNSTLNILKNKEWIVSDGNRLIYKNYPCLACSIFGTTGLPSLVIFSFKRGDYRKTESYITSGKIMRLRFFNEILLGRTGRKLLIETIPKDTSIVLSVGIKKPLIESLYVKNSNYNSEAVALSVIWLAFQLINAGIFRLGRFKSRGFGRIRIDSASNGDMEKIKNSLGIKVKETYYDLLTKKALEVVKEELRERLCCK